MVFSKVHPACPNTFLVLKTGLLLGIESLSLVSDKWIYFAEKGIIYQIFCIIYLLVFRICIFSFIRFRVSSVTMDTSPLSMVARATWVAVIILLLKGYIPFFRNAEARFTAVSDLR